MSPDSYPNVVLLLLRVYAIYGLNKLILVVGLVLNLSTVAINIYVCFSDLLFWNRLPCYPLINQTLKVLMY